jgi:hypothetical protein
MASRARSCHHLIPSVHVAMPQPAVLVQLAPLMATLMDISAEYEACADEAEPIPFNAVDWVRWLDQAVRDAVKHSVAHA